MNEEITIFLFLTSYFIFYGYRVYYDCKNSNELIYIHILALPFAFFSTLYVLISGGCELAKEQIEFCRTGDYGFKYLPGSYIYGSMLVLVTVSGTFLPTLISLYLQYKNKKG